MREFAKVAASALAGLIVIIFILIALYSTLDFINHYVALILVAFSSASISYIVFNIGESIYSFLKELKIRSRA